MKFKYVKKRKYHRNEINPDEIFLDSSNLPEFDTSQLEGRIEKAIPKSSLVFLGIFFLMAGGLYMIKLTDLQVVKGEDFRNLAENNRFQHIPLFAQRGVIFDKNNVPLVWNTPFAPLNKNGEVFTTNKESSHEPFSREEEYSQRTYIDKDGFAHILGYIRYPLRDSAGYYIDDEFEGKDGVELVYDQILGGANGLKIIETNALSEVQYKSSVRPLRDGQNIILTIDSRIQEKFFQTIGKLVRQVGFNAGAGVIMDIKTGALLSLVSYPEYNSNILSEGKDAEKISSYVENKSDPFLNRAVSGLYTPGSIVKPFIAISALNEGVIEPKTKILSTGSISIQHPYFPDKKSVFTDWKPHGWVTMREALAVSSNIYFYQVAGGFEGQKGVGIEKIEAYMKLFGLGKETGIDLPGELVGVIPTPQWKEKIFNDEWRIGDTYNTAIGQYGFQITPLQAVRAVAALGSGGYLVEPYLIASTYENNEEGRVVWKHKKKGGNIRYVKNDHFDVVTEGMRQAVLAGTAKGLNISAVSIAAKTGTAEVGVEKEFVNSWIIGFFPYENPQYAFSVVMEKGPPKNLIGALYVMRQLFDWMATETPEYLE